MIKNRIWGVPFYGMHNSETDIMVRYYVLQDVLDHGMEYIKWSSLKNLGCLENPRSYIFRWF